ncbi:MAG TPA: DUF2059 domain-containing protein [Pseudomonas xinjiangensis]|uniref:DUF2059 domain-containing protein n=2 Tax=root TaxID=1 RepID=A0A7V1BNR6_9GAMM|nr:DUF2059 domain-containing protein [Halopseudomonas xinjiangensis]HEC48496.1 DUF2059 domain-containing protein [Halopseudomonas xinjiangensis]
MRLTTFQTLILTLLATLILHSVPVQANPTAELYQASGMNQHQQHFQFALKAAQQRYAQQLPPSLYETLVSHSNLRFDPQGMHDRAQARLALALGEADHREAIEFYASALGRKVVSAETRATSPASIVAMQRGLPVPDISPERRQLLEQLGALLPALDLGVEVSLALAGLAAQSANSFLGGLMEIPQSVVTDRRDTLRGQMRANLPDTLAHVYRDLSDAELSEFLAWSESEHGKLYYRAVELAVRDALNP